MIQSFLTQRKMTVDSGCCLGNAALGKNVDSIMALQPTHKLKQSLQNLNVSSRSRMRYSKVRNSNFGIAGTKFKYHATAWSSYKLDKPWEVRSLKIHLSTIHQGATASTNLVVVKTNNYFIRTINTCFILAYTFVQTYSQPGLHKQYSSLAHGASHVIYISNSHRKDTTVLFPPCFSHRAPSHLKCKSHYHLYPCPHWYQNLKLPQVPPQVTIQTETKSFPKRKWHSLLQR